MWKNLKWADLRLSRVPVRSGIVKSQCGMPGSVGLGWSSGAEDIIMLGSVRCSYYYHIIACDITLVQESGLDLRWWR